VGIEFEDREEELAGTYRLAAKLSGEEGEAGAYDPDGERISLGRLSEGDPLRVEALVDPFGDSSIFFVDTGEVGDLRYEGTIKPA
jgi:hypothetical protein